MELRDELRRMKDQEKEDEPCPKCSSRENNGGGDFIITAQRASPLRLSGQPSIIAQVPFK
jgi:hypothetical protein